MKRLFLIMLTLMLTLTKGCGFFQEDAFRPTTPDVAKIVSQLEQPVFQAQPIDDFSVADLITRFEAVKSTSQSPDEQYQIAQRLAQLRLQSVEQQLADGESDIDFETPIAELESLLKFDVAKSNAGEIAYQLARMQEMKGAPDQVLLSLSELIDVGEKTPASLEASFRRAEIYFSRSDFVAAAGDYSRVAEVAGQYQLHARYMLTWVQFKRGDSDSALAMANSTFKQLAQVQTDVHRELKQDLLRVTVIALDYADGAETLAGLMAIEDKPDWQTDIYRALGDWYLEKSRYADSAETWATFLAENPLHKDAPKIALQVIATQREAGFVEDIPGLEVSFIERYGKQGDFFVLHGNAVFVQYRDELKAMLNRQTQRLHSVAQSTEETSDYVAAAKAYDVWLTNFSADADAQSKRFLYAEVLQSADRLEDALVQYALVLSEDATTNFARESAYALVIGEQTLARDVEAEIDANLVFAKLFTDDERAASSQLKAANLLFKTQQFEQAELIAERALEFDLPLEQVITARRIIGHSTFVFGDFVAAAKQYRTLLTLSPDTDIQQRLLATVFKQGQLAEKSGELMRAIDYYRSLAEIDPDSELSRDADYDIAAIYEQMEDTTLAIQQLEQFRQRHDTNKEEVALRLIGLYEASGDLDAAARELLASTTTRAGGTGGEPARIARYRAAELFLQSGNIDLAVEHFRYYAHNYPEPADLRLEAMHHMDLLYQQTGEQDKRKFWLRKKRATYLTLSESTRTERAKYLAAEASYLLASDQFDAFKAARLNQPLARSLKKKQRLLEATLKRYQETAEIGALTFVSRSNYQMAKLYQILAQDLLSSEQPDDLNELEQDQYVMLLEEQAYPFEEQAIALHQRNLQLGWQVSWDDAINSSLLALQDLSPGRFRRDDAEVTYVQSSD
jgi:TolA-binding protein